MSLDDLRQDALAGVKFKTNEWLIRRTINNVVISIIAQRIPTLSSWGVTCKLNGELVDHRQSDDVFKTAEEMIEEHLGDIDNIVQQPARLTLV